MSERLRPIDRRRSALVLVACLCLAEGARAKVSDSRLQFRPISLDKITVSGELEARLALTGKYLQGLPEAYLMGPFKRRTGQPFNGQFLACWIEFMTDYAALRRDADLKKQVDGYVAALLALQGTDGFIGLDANEPWDAWVANRLVSAFLRHAENARDLNLQSAATRLAKHLAGRFPPERAAAEPAVIGRCVLEAVARAYDYGRDYNLLTAARALPKRDTTRLLDFLAERRRLGYPERPPWTGNKAHEVMTYLNGLAALDQVAISQDIHRAVVDAWTDLDERHRYVTGGLPTSFDWGNGTSPADADDAAATAEWCLFNLNLWYATGEVQYIEMVERILFNHLAFSQAADGQFISNTDLHGREGTPTSAGTGEAARALVQALAAIYSVRREEVWVNLYVPSTVELKFDYSGTTATLTQTTALPVTGEVTLRVAPARPARFDLCLRIPSWAAGHTLSVNDKPVTAKIEKGYVRVSRQWAPADVVALNLNLEPRVDRRAGGAPGSTQVAVGFGPLVMCVDAQYNGGLRQPFRFVAKRGREPGLFKSVSPATVGPPLSPFGVPVVLVGKAYSAGRETVVHLTPLASCVRRPETWWRVWLTIYEPETGGS